MPDKASLSSRIPTSRLLASHSYGKSKRPNRKGTDLRRVSEALLELGLTLFLAMIHGLHTAAEHLRWRL